MQTNKRGDRRGMSTASRANLRPPFPKGTSGNSRGSTPNRVKAFNARLAIKADALTKDEIDTIEQSILSADFEDLKRVASEKDCLALYKAYAIAALTDMKAGKVDTFNKICTRQFGAPMQRTDITSNGATIATAIQVEVIDNRDKVETTTDEDSDH